MYKRQFLSTVALFGVQDALLYYIPKERHRTGSLWVSAIALTLCTSALFALGGYFLLPRLMGSQSGDVVRLSQQLLFMVSFYYPFHMMSLMVLRGSHKLILWNVFRIISNLVWFLLVGSAVIFQEASLSYFVWGQGIINIGMVLPFCLAASRTTHSRFSFDFSIWNRFLLFLSLIHI